jgi:hypothetical protein
MKPARTALAALLALAAVPLATTSAFAKSPRDHSVHSYILLDRTGSMEPIWTEALSSVNAYADGLATLDGGPRVDADITLAAFDANDGVTLAEKDNPRKAVIVIMTDGEENSSEEMTKASAKAALDRVRKKGWEVVFLGAEFSKFDDAEGVGQSSSRNMAVSKEQLSDSMRRLSQKSKDYASGAAPTVEFTAISGDKH